MPSEEHLARLREGVNAWNAWRKEHPDIVPDLYAAKLGKAILREAHLQGANLHLASLEGANLIAADLREANLKDAILPEADLREANLEGANLSKTWLREANLSEAHLQGANFFLASLEGANLIAADLREANLRRAKLVLANLSEVHLEGANLSGANLRGANLEGAHLSKAILQGARLEDARLRGANFEGAKIRGLDLRGLDLSMATLREADLRDADLCETNFKEADCRDVDFRQASLIDSCFDGANLTGAKLWEMQRGGWSIKGIICEHAFWDRDGKEPTEYGDGDFERIFAEKPRIVLRYPGGLSPVELAMLPLIIDRLQAEHPDCALHIRSVQEEGSGATVTITVEDLANRDGATFRNETVEQLQAKLKYIEGQRDLLIDQFMPIFRELVIRSGQTIIGEITGSTIMKGITMSGDTNINQGQAAIVGRQGHAHDMTFQQIQNSLDLPKLAEELGRLRSVMKQETEGTREQDKAVAAVAEAEEAAIKGDGPATLRHLKPAGKWALGIAEKIGVAVAADAIKKALGPLAGI
jgi:uncharacterized protein YjbI with pentapeptide repeats